MKLIELAEKLGGPVPSDAGEIEITGVAALRDAMCGDISFLSNKKYANQVATTKASVVLVPVDFSVEGATAVLLHVKSPDKAFAEIVPLFTSPAVVYSAQIHPTAILGEGVHLGEDVYIGPYAVIGSHVVLGARVIVEAHVVIGERCVIGEDAHLYPLSSIREGCRIGNRVTLHNGVVIGSDGYGYSTEVQADGSVKVEKIPQMGIVELCDDVEVGANTTIDRARFGITKIGRMTKIDNQVQVGHNVQIGEYCGIVAHVGIAGSTHLGNGVMLWGQVGLAGHLNLADGVEVLAQSGVAGDLERGVYFGSPAVGRREALKLLHMPKAIENLKCELAELKLKLKALEDASA